MDVLIDLDSIIVNLQDRWYAEYNREYSDSLTPEKVLDWDTSKFAKAGLHVYDVLRRPGFFRELPPLDGAIEGVRRVRDAGNEVFIVSAATCPAAMGDKALWVEEHLGSIIDPKRSLILAQSKDRVRGDVLFDDGPHNLIAYRKAWPSARLATIDYPYNSFAWGEADVDLVAGDYRYPAACWDLFARWIECGAPAFHVPGAPVFPHQPAIMPETVVHIPGEGMVEED